jgi:hypothetical protein
LLANQDHQDHQHPQTQTTSHQKSFLTSSFRFPFNQIKPTTSDDSRNVDKNGIANENIIKTRKKRFLFNAERICRKTFTDDSRFIPAFVLIHKKRDFATFTAFCFCIPEPESFESGRMGYRRVSIENRAFFQTGLDWTEPREERLLAEHRTVLHRMAHRTNAAISPLLSMNYTVIAR